MRWIRPDHTRWLAACVVGLLLSVWAGGLSVTVVFVFAIIFGAGAALIAADLPTVPEASAEEVEDDGAAAEEVEDDEVEAEEMEEQEPDDVTSEDSSG